LCSATKSISAAGATHFGTGLSALATMRGSPAACARPGNSINTSSSILEFMKARPGPYPAGT
jgi:hypothetical protein